MNWTDTRGKEILKLAYRLKHIEQSCRTYREVAETINRLYDEDVNEDMVRRALNRHRNWLQSTFEKADRAIEMERAIDEDIDVEEEFEEALQKEKEKAARDREKRLLQKLMRERARTELIIDTFKECIKAFPQIDITSPEPIDIKKDVEEAVLLFSDAQIGERVTKEETNGLGEYNIDIFRSRMRFLTDEVRRISKIQQMANRIEHLNIFMLGDNVDGINVYRGQVHHLDSLIVDQFLIGAHEIAASLIKLLDTFKKIRVWGIVGNHGRIGRKGENPSYINWDFLLYKVLSFLLKNYNDRIKWNIPLSNWTVATVNQQNFLLLHGDTIRAWNGLPYYGIDRADSRLTTMLAAHEKTYRYMCLGHHHNPADIDSPGGEKILNGTMVGGSNFSINQLHTSSRPSQWFFGVHHKRGITWRHKIILDEAPIVEEFANEHPLMLTP